MGLAYSAALCGSSLQISHVVPHGWVQMRTGGRLEEDIVWTTLRKCQDYSELRTNKVRHFAISVASMQLCALIRVVECLTLDA